VMDVHALREGLAATIRTALASASPTPTVTSYPPGVPECPHVFLAEQMTDFDVTHRRGVDRINLTVRVLTSFSDQQEGVHLLNDFCSGSGPASIKEAIESGRRAGTDGRYAGDICHDLRVTTSTSWAQYDHGASTYWGCEYNVEIYGDGS